MAGKEVLLIPCMDVFATAPEDDSFVAHICEQAPDCRCEICQVSPHCAVPVADDETLIRLVVDDVHVERDESGRLLLRSSFLNDAASFGSSTLRLGRATQDEFRSQIERLLSSGRKKADGSPREVIGFVRVSAGIVRSLRTEKDKDQRPFVAQLCGIYATGLEDVPNHADLALNAVERLSNGGRVRSIKTLGAAVRDAFQAVNSVDEIIALAAS